MEIKTIGVLSGQEVIGDALIKLPFLRALRQAWPHARIHWITSRAATAYSGPMRETVRPFIDEIHEVPEWLNVRHAPEAPSFDLLIDTRGRWKLALQARWRLKHRLFIAPAFRFALSQHRPPLFSKRPKRLVNRLLQLVELASSTPPSVSNRLPISPDMQEKALKALPEGPVYIGLAPGAGNEIKKWPLPNFIALAREVEARGYKPVFILGPQEQDIYEELRTALPSALFPLQATDIWPAPPKVDHTLAIATRLTLAVTNDSGTSHMLAAVDCPLISLFGPTSADKLAPEVTYGFVIKAQDFGCDNMDSITKESVLKHLDKAILLLESKRNYYFPLPPYQK